MTQSPKVSVDVEGHHPQQDTRLVPETGSHTHKLSPGPGRMAGATNSRVLSDPQARKCYRDS